MTIKSGRIKFITSKILLNLFLLITAYAICSMPSLYAQHLEKVISPDLPKNIDNAIVFNDRLWIINQNEIWSSSTGTQFTCEVRKVPFPPRSYFALAVFLGKLWLIGGINDTRCSDIWNSSDGKTWFRVVEKAPFGERCGQKAIVFKNKLWLIGGSTATDNVAKDIWSSEDGINWKKEGSNAVFNRYGFGLIVFKDKMWVIGGIIGNRACNDIWSSEDGILWKQAAENAGFSKRYGIGYAVYKDKIWMIGGLYDNDCWTSPDGLHWECLSPKLELPARQYSTCLEFKDSLWIIGGYKMNDLWRLQSEADKITGNVNWPKTWTAFSPFPADDAVPSTDVLKNVPSEMVINGKTAVAQIVRPKEDGTFDFAQLWGGVKPKSAAYVFLRFDSQRDQEINIGMGADWWFQAWIDGKPLHDTLGEGNIEWPPSICNYVKKIFVSKGEHVLALRFISGTGSSVLAIGGPSELRHVSPDKWKTAKENKDETLGAEKVLNGSFEGSGDGKPWIPQGWQNAVAPFSFEDKELGEYKTGALGGMASLSINTLSGPPHRRKLYTRLSLEAGRQYKISFKTRHVAGGNIALSLRENIDTGAIYFIKALNSDTSFYTGYRFIENPRPYLVIEVSGPSHAIIDDISVRACFDKSKHYNSWAEQHSPADISYCEISNIIPTPHTVWGKPHIGGTAKVLTLMPFSRLRSAVELEQRLDVKCEPVIFGSNSELGKPYWIRDRCGEPLLHDPLVSALDRPMDCMIIDYLNASAIPQKMGEKILENVKRGSGLVIVGFNQPYYPYKDGKREEALDKYKTGFWKTALCPANAFVQEMPHVPLGSVANMENEFYKYGNGRIAYLRGGDNLRGTNLTEFESRMSYIGKAVLWASNRVAQIVIASVEMPGGKAGAVQRDDLPSSIRVNLSKTAEKDMTLNLWVSDQDSETEYKNITKLTDASGSVTIVLPKLKSGKHYVNMQLCQNGRIYDWETLPLNVTTKLILKEISIVSGKSPYFTRGELLNGKIMLERELTDDEHLEISLVDTDNNLWYKSDVHGKSNEVPFTFDTSRLIVLHNTLKAKVVDRNGTVSEIKRAVNIAPQNEQQENHFNFGIWSVGNDYMGLLAYNVMRKKYGVDFIMGNSPAVAANIRNVPYVGYGPALYPGIHNEIIGEETSAPARKYCLTSSIVKSEVALAIGNSMRLGGSNAPLAYFIDHEDDILGYVKRAKPGTDICFSKSCINDFHSFLEKEYKDISSLNKSWNSNFKNWSEAKPVALSDALKNEQISRWIDHRRHMDRVWTDFSLFRLNEIRKYDSQANAFAMNYRSGPDINDSFNGIDYWQLMHEAVGCAMMPPSYQESFVKQCRRHLVWQAGQCWHPETISDHSELKSARLTAQVWKGILCQYGGFELYSTCLSDSINCIENNDTAFVMPDLRTTTEGEIFAGAMKQIRNGIDTFVLNSKKDISGIGLYYSRASEHACTAWQALNRKNQIVMELNPRRSQFTFWAPAIQSVGRGFASVAYGQVADGILQKGDIKVLIIPFSQSISLKEVENIKDFVAQGGCLIADIRPGISDEHGRFYGEGLLDSVFGVRHDPAWNAYVPKKGNVLINVANEELSIKTSLTDVILGQNLALAGAKTYGKADVPVFTINKYGKGKAILLNFYSEQKDNANTMEFDRFFNRILEFCGIPRLFSLEFTDICWLTEGGEKVPVQAFSEVRNKKSLGISIGSEDAGDVEGLAGNTSERCVPVIKRLINGGIECLGLWYEISRGNGVQNVRIHPQRKGHVYDLTTNTYLGEIQESYEVKMPLDGLIFHAIAPYRIQKPLLKAETRINSDGARSILCEAIPQPQAATGEQHVLRFSLISPNGDTWADFSVNKIARNGIASHAFILPLNAPRGKWRIHAKEAISGLENTATIEN